MNIAFRLAWIKQGAPGRRAFRLPGAWELMSEYVARIKRCAPCVVEGGRRPAEGARLWVCDRGPGAKVLLSEELAMALSGAREAGDKRLEVMIGGPDGITQDELRELKPALRWSFGPQTLPHELAAVVAAEQLYRAWTIIKNQPYHLAH